MATDNSTSIWQSDRVLNGVFLAGNVYFILTTLFSLIHYQEKFLYDGTALIFHITNFEWFPQAAQREIFYLQQIIPVGFSMAGLPIKWVMLGYVFNVYLLYYLMFFVIIRVFKDAPASILLLLVHYKGAPYNYFMMVEELLPAVCMLVVLCSLVRNFSIIKDARLAYVVTGILLVLIIRSHPLALACLAGVVPIIFLSNREFFTQHKKAIAAFGAFSACLIGLKFLALNPYDASRVAESKSILHSSIELLYPANLSEMLFYLFFMRKIFTIVVSIIVIYFIMKGYYRELLITLLVTYAMVAVFNTMVFDPNFNSWNLTQMKYDLWSLPVRFVIFTSFCFLVLREVQNFQAYRYLSAGFIFYFLVGTLQIPEQLAIGKSYIRQANKIIEQCHREGVAKAVVDLNELKEYIPLHHNAYQDILVLSALKNPVGCVQAVYIDDEFQPSLHTYNDDQIILDQNGPILHREILNSRYYYLPEEPYRKISLN